LKSKNNAMKGTMIILGHIPGGITGSGHRKWDTSPGGVKAYSLDMKRVRWPVNFKPSGLEKYDGSTNPAEWLELYQLTIEATRGDSYIMENYLLVYLSSSPRTWLLRLPMGSVRFWNHLRRLFTNNFHTTYARLGVDWELASIV
jgi:hypothetical protein